MGKQFNENPRGGIFQGGGAQRGRGGFRPGDNRGGFRPGDNRGGF
jgi:hypothetical protein